jgi:acyl-CoA thioesterase
MSDQPTPLQIAQWMVEHDRFARGLGITLEWVEPGSAAVSMIVEEEMCNSVGITHGGASFTLADFAFAVACNSHGRVSVGLSAEIHYPAPSRPGDRLIATAREVNLTHRTGLYSIEIHIDGGPQVALFTGTAYRRSETVAGWIQPQT